MAAKTNVSRIKDRLLLRRLTMKLQDKIREKLHIEQNKIHWAHVKKTTWALLLSLPFLLLEWSSRTFDLYTLLPGVDSVIHFLFGIAFASVASLIYSKRAKSIGFWIVAISIAWEIIEQIGDIVIKNQPPIHIDYIWPDGIKDGLMNIIGAALAYFTLKKTGVFEHKI